MAGNTLHSSLAVSATHAPPMDTNSCAHFMSDAHTCTLLCLSPGSLML